MSSEPHAPASTETSDGIAELPYVDEHAVTVRVADPGFVWRALGEAIERGWRVPGFATRLLATDPSHRSGAPLLAGSTMPGFRVAIAEPGMRLALQGRHRFSSYALIFHITAEAGEVRLSAETRARFPGVGGRLYRGLVIGTRGHVLVVRALLSATRRLAERRAA